MQVRPGRVRRSRHRVKRRKTSAIKVVTPIDDTPAAKAGILSGIITDIDGEAVQGAEALNQAGSTRWRGAIKHARDLDKDRAWSQRSRKSRGGDRPRTSSRFSQCAPQCRGATTLDYYLRASHNLTNRPTMASRAGPWTSSRRDAPEGDKLKGYILDLRNNQTGRQASRGDRSRQRVGGERGEIVSTRGSNAG